MRRPPILCLLVLLLGDVAVAQREPDVLISAGERDRNYFAVASRLRLKLGEDTDLFVDVLGSNGSIDNLERLANPDGPVGVAFTQADALSGFLEERPELAAQIAVLGDIGKECAILVSKQGSGPATLGALAAHEGGQVAVGQPGSGAAVTWAAMARIQPALADTGAVETSPAEALARIKAGAGGDLVAAMVVQRPQTVSQAIEVLLDDANAFQLVNIAADDLATPSLPGGDPVYHFETVRIRNLSLDTICTRGLIVVHQGKVPADVREQIAEVLLRHARYITPDPE